MSSSSLLAKLSVLLPLLPLLVRGEIHLDKCASPLGMEDGRLEAHQLSASSSYEPSTVGPNNARLNVDTLGGAWCPRELIGTDTSEWLEVDLGRPHVVSSVLTQGRFGNGHGKEFAVAYLVEYWRPGMDAGWKRHTRGIFAANTNTHSVVENRLEPPIVAQKVRVVPYSQHPRTVCMRIELNGCPYDEGVIAYSITAPYPKDDVPRVELADDSYDGAEVDAGLRGGLGQLMDGVKGAAVGSVERDVLGGYEFVGWKNESFRPIEVSLAFGEPRRVTAIRLYVHRPEPAHDLGGLTEVRVSCSAGPGARTSFAFGQLEAATAELGDAAGTTSVVTLAPSHAECLGREVSLRLFFHGKWLAISEIGLDSAVVDERREPLEQDISVDLQPQKPTTTTTTPATTTTTSTTTTTTEKVFFPVAGEEEEKVPISRRPRDDEWWESRYLGIAIGVLTTVIVLLVIVVIVILHKERLSSKPLRRCYASVGNVSGGSGQGFFLPSSATTASELSYGKQRLGQHHQHHQQLQHQQQQQQQQQQPIYTEPIFTFANAEQQPSQGCSEYASPLLLYSNSPPTMASSPHLLLAPNSSPSTGFSRPKPTIVSSHTLGCKPASSPNWADFFPRPPSGPPPSPPPGPQHQHVQCYASTDIC